MGLHRNVRVQVVESTVGLLTTVPAALVHALDFLISATWALVLLRARDGHKTVDLRVIVLVRNGIAQETIW